MKRNFSLTSIRRTAIKAALAEGVVEGDLQGSSLPFKVKVSESRIRREFRVPFHLLRENERPMLPSIVRLGLTKD